ncbi:hypothetical protein AK830_g8216 [Neonectria ditissima]|uniref:Uncharacterized protein n=1 Tax=Neonectria ditissima TaxID=78410 RepID=A0A0P7BBT9_9HYPO|nr:hypothetical protein AK830_g8216 [Neonectria ditissima]
MSVLLCGKQVNCFNSSSYQDDPTDPDIAGIGVILSFVLTAFISMLVMIFAYVNRGLPDQQYVRLDVTILSRIDSCFKRNKVSRRIQTDDVTTYQVVLLAISDQFVVTGTGILLALFSQMCSISAFSFHIGVNLSYFCLAAHLNTLIALRVHFSKNPSQKKLRIFLLFFSNGIMLVGKFLQYLTWTHEPKRLSACTIKYYEDDLGLVMWEWAALALATWYSCYYSSLGDSCFNGVEPSKQHKELKLVQWFLYRVKSVRYNDEDIETCRRQKDGECRKAAAKKANKLLRILDKKTHQPQRHLRVVGIIFSDLYIDLTDSLVFHIFVSMFWFGSSIIELTLSLRDSDVDLSALWEAKFGQVMPLLVLLVFPISAMEARKTAFNVLQLSLINGVHKQLKTLRRAQPMKLNLKNRYAKQLRGQEFPKAVAKKPNNWLNLF